MMWSKIDTILMREDHSLGLDAEAFSNSFSNLSICLNEKWSLGSSTINISDIEDLRNVKIPEIVHMIPLYSNLMLFLWNGPLTVAVGYLFYQLMQGGNLGRAAGMIPLMAQANGQDMFGDLGHNARVSYTISTMFGGFFILIVVGGICYCMLGYFCESMKRYLRCIFCIPCTTCIYGGIDRCVKHKHTRLTSDDVAPAAISTQGREVGTADDPPQAHSYSQSMEVDRTGNEYSLALDDKTQIRFRVENETL